MPEHEETWTTELSTPRKAFDDFREILARTHFDWDLDKVNTDEQFRADVRRRVFDDVVFTEVSCMPCAGTRGRAQINTASDAYICLALMESGQQFFSHGDDYAQIGRGDMLLWDAVRPGRFIGESEVRCLTVLFPRQQIARYVMDVDDLCARKISGCSGTGLLLHSYLTALHRTIQEIDSSERTAVFHSTLELVAACFRPEHKIQGKTAYQKALLRRVQDFVLENLHDGDLTPSRVASKFRFSTRYLHHLFEATDTTFSEWIRLQKLERAKRILSDPRFVNETITTIAFRLGFGSSEHFSRSFRAHIGMSPRDYRASVLGSH